MQMMRAIWIMLKLMIRFSVLMTVAKLRFSRVRKYFWFREIVDSWPDTLKMDSSRIEVCSGVVPCLEGSWARASFSTCKWDQLGTFISVAKGTDSNLEVDVFLSEGAHLVVEAEGVFADLVCGKDEVALSLLLAVHNNLAIGAFNNVVDIERTTGLDLHQLFSLEVSDLHIGKGPYSKVECDLLRLLFRGGVKASLLVRS